MSLKFVLPCYNCTLTKENCSNIVVLKIDLVCGRKFIKFKAEIWVYHCISKSFKV